jgi:NitT/TauT family transport system substrate-binding protein
MAFRRPLMFALLAGAAATTLVAACSSSGSTGNATLTGTSSTRTGPLEKTHLTVYAEPTTDSAGLYIAQYEGLFKAAGLTLNIQPAQTAEEVIDQQALGKIDITAGNYVSYVQAQENHDAGVPVTGNDTPQALSSNLDIFAEASELNPGFMGLYVPAGSPISTFADLKGKTIGINAPDNVAYLLVAATLEANGVSPNSVKWAYYSFPDMESALLKHKIQVALLAEPYASIADENAGVTELTDVDQGLAESFPVEGYAVTKQWAKANPNTLATFTRVLEEGQELADTNRELAEKAMMAQVPGLSSEYAALLTMEDYPVGPVDSTRLQRVANDMQALSMSSTSLIFQVQKMIGDGSHA